MTHVHPWQCFKIYQVYFRLTKNTDLDLTVWQSDSLTQKEELELDVDVMQRAMLPWAMLNNWCAIQFMWLGACNATCSWTVSGIPVQFSLYVPRKKNLLMLLLKILKSSFVKLKSIIDTLKADQVSRFLSVPDSRQLVDGVDLPTTSNQMLKS